MLNILNIIKEELILFENTYHGQHTAPRKQDSTSAPLHDVTNVYPEDIYSDKASRYYGDGYDYDEISANIIKYCRNKPNQKVKIYRAIPKIITNQEKINNYLKQKQHIQKTGKLPKGVDNWKDRSEYYEYISNEIDRLKSTPNAEEKVAINPGDWVTINPYYAKAHGESNLNNKYRILTKTVLAKELYTDGNSMHEWGYYP